MFHQELSQICRAVLKSKWYGVYDILDIYFLLYSIFNRSSDNQLVFRWIQTSLFNLPVDRHSVFEIRYLVFEIRNSVSRLLKIRNSIPNFFLDIRRPLILMIWITHTYSTSPSPSALLIYSIFYLSAILFCPVLSRYFI